MSKGEVKLQEPQTKFSSGRGGWRGGLRPSVWKGSQAQTSECIRAYIPRTLKEDIMTVAHWLDEGRVTVEQIRELLEKHDDGE